MKVREAEQERGDQAGAGRTKAWQQCPEQNEPIHQLFGERRQNVVPHLHNGEVLNEQAALRGDLLREQHDRNSLKDQQDDQWLEQSVHHKVSLEHVDVKLA